MTIYTSLKPGDGRIREIQSAALENWRALGCEVVELEGPAPFQKVAQTAAAGASQVCAWCNADILFDGGLKDVVAWGEAQRDDFLIVGRRTDLLQGGQRELHRPSGMDYFIFRKGMFRDLPPTVMGRSYCDSALLAHCLRRGIRVIDATDVMTATHQWHDYGHVAGGRDEVFGGAEAQANKRNNRLKDFGPHIADVRWRLKFEVKGKGQDQQRNENTTVRPSTFNLQPLTAVPKRVPLLRRLGMWGLWNRLTRGGIGLWGIHEYVGAKGARFFTRSKIIQNFKHSNVVWKFNHLGEWEKGIYTGFDFPCLMRGLAEKRRSGEPWTVYLWDPPSLSHRDNFPSLRWTIDFVWRLLARHCDKLVLHIHPGLLEEMKIKVANGKWGSVAVEYRMQDAFGELENGECGEKNDGAECKYDFGVLGNWTKAKGGPLMAEALSQMPGAKCLWIGNPPASFKSSAFTFTGSLPQEQAFEQLKQCRILVAPYLPVPSLKWNYVLKLFEYLQLGRPILASDNPGNAAVAEKYPGRITLFKSGDCRDFVAKCAEIVKGGGRAMKCVHVVGDRAVGNGMYAVAKMLTEHDGGAVMSCAEFSSQNGLSDVDEVVVHGCWMPCYWRTCRKVLKSRAAIGRPRLVRMTHGSMSPVYLEHQGKWKKRLASPVERWLFNRADRVIVTCAAERTWCEEWGLKGPFEIVDLKRFFKFPRTPKNHCVNNPLHILYLGRRHPLKGIAHLQRAADEIKEKASLRIVSDHSGAELERDWEWCDVLCLPTLSENFGLVVAEALERGKRVITTDGAPAWEGQEGVVYLRGYRDGDDAKRIALLKEALCHVR